MRPSLHHLVSVKRPNHLNPPKHLSPSPPVPEPERVDPATAPSEEERLDPTRYGDWEKDGKAVDF